MALVLQQWKITPLYHHISRPSRKAIRKVGGKFKMYLKVRCDLWQRPAYFPLHKCNFPGHWRWFPWALAWPMCRAFRPRGDDPGRLFDHPCTMWPIKQILAWEAKVDKSLRSSVQPLHLPFWQSARGSCKSENWRNWTSTSQRAIKSFPLRVSPRLAIATRSSDVATA